MTHLVRPTRWLRIVAAVIVAGISSTGAAQDEAGKVPQNSVISAGRPDTVSARPSSPILNDSGSLTRPSKRLFDRNAAVAQPIDFLAPASLLNVDKKAPAPWYGPLASLVVPGTGQAIFRQQRSVAYLVAEGFLALRAVRAHRDRNAAKAQYQKLAADVARAPFGAERPVGSWDYYETLEHFTSSGAYDLAVGGKFTPETDIDTYNGLVWYRARRLFWESPEQAPAESSPEYLRALNQYKVGAVQASFRWSWKDQANVQNEYILSIGEANRSKQQLVSTFGLLAVNHLASFVDGYITVRLRRYGGAGLVGAAVKTEVRPTGGFGDNAYGAAMTVSVPVGGVARRW